MVPVASILGGAPSSKDVAGLLAVDSVLDDNAMTAALSNPWDSAACSKFSRFHCRKEAVNDTRSGLACKAWMLADMFPWMTSVCRLQAW